MVYSSASREEVQVPDDALEILHDCRALYLQKLNQLLQEGERLPSKAQQVFQEGVGRYFDAMTSPQRKSEFGESDGLTASHISLVGDNDLELEIRLSEFSARLLEKSGGELWRVYLRFVTLLNRPDLSTADNPVGPKGIAEGLHDLCAELAENHEKTLERLNRLEVFFADNLNILYGNLNDFLAERQVETAQPSFITAADSARAAPALAAVNPAAALQRNLLGPNVDFNAVPAGGAASGGSGTGGGGGTAAASLFTQAMFDRLLSRLDELEKIGHFGPGVSAATQTLGNASLETLIPGLFTATTAPAAEPAVAPRSFNADELGIPSGAPEAATIDALALIFEAIFAAENLPASIKSTLASLQIPLLKAAMLDNTFFTAENHPARLLLDKMARAALGLPLDASFQHPLCTSLHTIASHVRSEFSRDMQVFKRYVDELDTLIDGRDQAAARIADRYQPLLGEFERQNQAALRSQQVIEQFCQPETPASIADFLRKHWHGLLQSLWLVGGEQSTDWQEHVAVIETLLWSIQSKTDMDDRKQLARKLPAMLKLLNSGMDKIAIPEDQRSAFLDTCFSLQTAALRGVVLKPAITPAASVEALVEVITDFGNISLSGMQLKTARQRGSSLPSRPSTGLRAKTGDWLDFEFAGQHLCGRLFLTANQADSALLSNPDWPFAIAMPVDMLAQQLRDKRASIASAASLFNTAAEKALRDAPKKDVLA